MSKEIKEKLLDIEFRPEFKILAEPKFYDKLFVFQTPNDHTAYGAAVDARQIDENKTEILVVARVGDSIRPFVIEKEGEQMTNILDLNFCVDDECSYLLEKGHILDTTPDELEIKLLDAMIK